MRHILHADFDAFYTSVEQLDNPDLRGKPVVVGGSPDDRGVVASASYEARKFGVRSAMPMRTALRLCPEVIRVGSRFDRYREVSRQVMAIFHDITPLVEPLSLDEAYLDVTDRVTQELSSQSIAAELKARVKSELGLTISVGVACSKSVAKIASDMDKPDGLTVVAPGHELEFLAPLAVSKLWGVGPKTAERLNSQGIQTIGDLAGRTEDWMRQRFGSNGAHMRRLALGQDDSEVKVERETKSVSAETTFSEDTGEAEALLETVSRLSQRVAHSLERKELQGRTVKLKLRLSDFTTFTRQKTVAEPVHSSDDLANAAGELLRAELLPGRTFRLVGVGVSGFEGEESASDEPRQLRLSGFE
ncbi:MAG: DNA polymerase IV [Chloroflexi bacterium]|nr:DNA polymerase IV [Chloroflexota bacterium]MDA1226761.1 DNA polymerase IV [Chloroflexota bacterium]